MRDAKRLAAVRLLPCVKCGQSPSEACHANWSECGKSMGKKASDEYTIPMCRACHKSMDLYEGISRREAKEMFDQWLIKANRMLSMEDKEVF